MSSSEKQLIEQIRRESIDPEVLFQRSDIRGISQSHLEDIELSLVKSESKTKTHIPFKLTGVSRVLVIGDIHAPFHHVEGLTIALKYAKAAQVDCIILNGDFLDCHALSRFIRRPDNRDFGKELSITLRLLQQIRTLFPNIRIIFKVGNHEERYQHFIWTKAPEFFNVKAFQLEELLELDKLGIEYVDDRRTIQLGKLNIVHGHEFYNAPGLINIARTLRLKANDNILVNHFHRSTEDVSRRIRGSVMAGFSLGCLCELNPYYMPNNNWNLGFGLVELSSNGEFDVVNKRILSNRLH